MKWINSISFYVIVHFWSIFHVSHSYYFNKVKFEIQFSVILKQFYILMILYAHNIFYNTDTYICSSITYYHEIRINNNKLTTMLLLCFKLSKHFLKIHISGVYKFFEAITIIYRGHNRIMISSRSRISINAPFRHDDWF